MAEAANMLDFQVQRLLKEGSTVRSFLGRVTFSLEKSENLEESYVKIVRTIGLTDTQLIEDNKMPIITLLQQIRGTKKESLTKFMVHEKKTFYGTTVNMAVAKAQDGTVDVIANYGFIVVDISNEWWWSRKANIDKITELFLHSYNETKQLEETKK